MRSPESAMSILSEAIETSLQCDSKRVVDVWFRGHPDELAEVDEWLARGVNASLIHRALQKVHGFKPANQTFRTWVKERKVHGE